MGQASDVHQSTCLSLGGERVGKKLKNASAKVVSENAYLRKLSEKFLETPEHPDDRTLEFVRKIDHLSIRNIIMTETIPITMKVKSEHCVLKGSK